MPGLPGSQSLLSQQAGFGPVNPMLPLTTEELQLRSLRADSSEKQKVDFPTCSLSAQHTKGSPSTLAAITRTADSPTPNQNSVPRNRDSWG